MKKMMFSALACVAFAFSGFASNEVVEAKEFVSDINLETEVDDFNLKVEDFAPCEIVIIVRDKKGDIVDALVDHSFRLGGDPCVAYGFGQVRLMMIKYPGHSLEIGINS